MGDGVIGSPPAFGAGKSRFESESPSSDRRPRPRRSVSEPLPSGAAPEGGIAAVVVLAAGQGTRMRSSTPKVLHALGGRSMLGHVRSEKHTAELQSRQYLVCRLLLGKKKINTTII